MANENTPSLAVMQAEMSDLYKDAFGARPRHILDSDWNDAEYMAKLWAICIEALKSR